MSGKVKFSLAEADQLANASLQKLGYNEQQAKRITHHLIDSELRGFGIAGLARILSIADRLDGKKPATTTKITREAPAVSSFSGCEVVIQL
jgi:delta1-piperideine-2-carboxylate reductase